MRYGYYAPHLVNDNGYDYTPNNSAYAPAHFSYPHSYPPEMHYETMPPSFPHEMYETHQQASALMPAIQQPQPSFRLRDKRQAINDLDNYFSFFFSNSTPPSSLFYNIENTLDQLTLSNSCGMSIRASHSKYRVEILFVESNGSRISPTKDNYRNADQRVRIHTNVQNYFLATKALSFLAPIIVPYIQHKIIGKNNISFTYNNPEAGQKFEANISLESGVAILLDDNKRIHLPADRIDPASQEMVAQSTENAHEAIEAFRNFLFSRTIIKRGDYTPPGALTKNSASLKHKQNQIIRFTLQNDDTLKLELIKQGKIYNIALPEYIEQEENKDMAWRTKMLFEKKLTFLPTAHIPESYRASSSWAEKTTRSPSSPGR